LHICPSIDSKVAADICEKLQVPLAVFPRGFIPPTLRLVPGALEALEAMNHYATIVTLSNVSCLDADTDQLRALFHPWIRDHFQSCRIGYAKPDPLAFRHVADACGVTTANMIHIGDDWICDVGGPRQAGVTAIWLSNGRRVPEPERLNDHTVLVADDIVIASQLVSELARRRQ
jgi:FMN phosphatase YigB (HAD superfamily)